jgi:acyl-CoA thioester hydrolase
MHATRLRVRLSETDKNGVVYYSQYFVYFDVAKSNFLRHEGLDPIGLGDKRLRLLAAETGCTYHAPAQFDDSLAVRVWVRKVGNSSVVFDLEVRRGKATLAEGYLVNVLVDAGGKPVRLPEVARVRLARHMKKS